MKKIGLFFVILSFGLRAGELPGEFFSISMYSEYFRQNIENKITQMSQNFVKVVSPGEVYFFSNSETSCQNGEKVPARQKIMSISFSKELKGQEYTESRIYKGCGGHVSFKEILRVSGASSELHTDKEIFEGKMDLDSPESQRAMSYELKDGEGKLVFSGYFKRFGKSTSTVFKLGDSKFSTRTTDVTAQGKKVIFKAYPFEFNQSRNGYRINFDSNGNGTLMALITDMNTIYYNNNRERTSMANFQGSFNLGGLDIIMDSMLAELPETKFVTTGTQDAKMLEELRTAQTFLISGTQLNLVRELVEKYIKAVEEGSIVDNR